MAFGKKKRKMATEEEKNIVNAVKEIKKY